MLAFICLGSTANKNESSLRRWNVEPFKNKFMVFRVIFPVYSFNANEEAVCKLIMSRGVILWQCLQKLKNLRKSKEVKLTHLQDKSNTVNASKKIGDVLTDEERELVEGRFGYSENFRKQLVIRKKLRI